MKSRNELQEELLDLFDGNHEALKAFYILKETDTPVFLTGKAGTGKSTFIKLAETISDTICKIVAPTGIAAWNVNGKTINSMFHLPHRLVIPRDSLLKEIQFSKDAEFELYNCDLLIFDEISMVTSATVDCIDVILRWICKSDKPFGGKKVLFVGDPFQLAPVVKKEERSLLYQDYQSEYFFHSETFEEMNPLRIELQINYRQKDGKYVKILNDIREYTNLSRSITILNNCCYTNGNNTSLEARKNSINLAFTNGVADQLNNNGLEQIEEELHTFHATVEGNFDWSSVTAERELRLKKGARIMFNKNDLQGLYVNGSLGNVVDIDGDNIAVTTDDGQSFELSKEVWNTEKNVSTKDKNGRWESKREVVGRMIQYPIKLAWAITVHKSQGLTFDNVHLVNPRSSFAAGQTYVALSRCRTLEGLSLSNRLSPSDIIVDDRILKFYKTIEDDVERVDELIEKVFEILDAKEAEVTTIEK